MTKNVSFELRDARGGSLFARRWEPEGEKIGGVAIVHGLGDHSGRFTNVAQVFAGAGYLVLAHDQLGHGQSGGLRGHVPSYSWLLDDIGQLVDELCQRVGPGPVFLYGQSLGGNLVMNYVLRRRPRVNGVIASSPLFLPTLQPPIWKRALARLLNCAWPSITFATGINASDLSHDSAVTAAYESDPLVHGRVSARLAIEMLAAGRWATEHARELAIPALIMHGDCDAVTSCDASSRFSVLAGEGCTIKIWPGLFHELHWEPERQAVLEFVMQWMKEVAG